MTRSFSLQQPPPPPTTRITRSLSMSIMETLQVGCYLVSFARVCRNRIDSSYLIILVPFWRLNDYLKMPSSPCVAQNGRQAMIWPGKYNAKRQEIQRPLLIHSWNIFINIYSAEDTVVPANGKALIKTDLSIAIPIDTYARIAPRSGLAWKKHIDVGAGVIGAH